MQSLGVVMETGLARRNTGINELIGEDQLLWPRADCVPSTSELIGEDLGAIISLDANQ